MTDEVDLADFDDHDLFEEQKKLESVDRPQAEEDPATTPHQQVGKVLRSRGWGGQQSEKKKEKVVFEQPTRYPVDDEGLFSTILVSKLPFEVPLSKLVHHFEKFGPLNEVVLERDHSRAFVRFAQLHAAKNAAKAPFQLFTQRMTVERVREQENELGDVISIILARETPITVILEQMERKPSFRASVPATASAVVPPPAVVDVQLQKYQLRLKVDEKNLANARTSLQAKAEGMKAAKDKLSAISKDPSQRKEVIDEVTNFAVEVKHAQANVALLEAKFLATKTELEEYKAGKNEH